MAVTVAMSRSESDIATSTIRIQSINQASIERRLALLGLNSEDEKLAAILQSDVVASKTEDIIENFYATLSQHASFNRVIQQGFNVQALKKTQKDYLTSLGVNFQTPEYFHQRLLIGLMHAKVGVLPSLYQCSYRLLQQLLINAIPEYHEQRDALISFILKITTLDMSLAIEAYEEGLTANLRSSVETLTDEKTSLSRELATDALTATFSRRRILEILAYLLDITKADNPTSIIMVDLDYFKKINDQYGHVVGDDVLKQTAECIRQAMRSSNSLGRYGGEEFIAVLPYTNLSQAAIVADRIRLKINEKPIVTHGHTINLTLSLGVASTTRPEPINEFIDRADKALYQAKELGRNRIQLSSEEDTVTHLAQSDV